MCHAFCMTNSLQIITASDRLPMSTAYCSSLHCTVGCYCCSGTGVCAHLVDTCRQITCYKTHSSCSGRHPRSHGRLKAVSQQHYQKASKRGIFNVQKCLIVFIQETVSLCLACQVKVVVQVQVPPTGTGCTRRMAHGSIRRG